MIVAAHHAAVAQTLGVIERDVARTRTGHAGSAVLPTRGLVAAGFDHYDSRAGDPQLHTHVTVANRVQGLDGKWRTLHGSELFRATVAMSATYDALLADHLTRQLGLTWETRRRGRDRNPVHELAAIPDALITEFSRRTAVINDSSERGHRPIHRHPRPGTHRRGGRSHAAARHTEHPAGQTHPAAGRLHHAVAGPRRRDPAHRPRRLGRRPPRPAEPKPSAHSARRVRPCGSECCSPQAVPAAGRRHPGPVRRRGRSARAGPGTTRHGTCPAGGAHYPGCSRPRRFPTRRSPPWPTRSLAATEERRSTWSRWNLTAETIRAIRDRGWQFSTPRDLLSARDRVLAQAIGQSVSLDPPELAEVPGRVARPHHRTVSVRRPRNLHLPRRPGRRSPPPCGRPGPSPRPPRRPCRATVPGSPEQVAAVEAICASGRTLDVLVGPAGTGKTATINRPRRRGGAPNTATTPSCCSPSPPPPPTSSPPPPGPPRRPRRCG